jgi:hypothetical protein
MKLLTEVFAFLMGCVVGAIPAFLLAIATNVVSSEGFGPWWSVVGVLVLGAVCIPGGGALALRFVWGSREHAAK